MIICSSNQTVHAFYVKFNIVTPFPVSEQLLCCFAAFLADEGLSPQTTKSYLAAVQNMQISLGLPDPRDQSSLPILKRVLAGICRARLARRMPARVRLPITGPLLARICTALHSSSHPEKALIWVISSVAFFGFFRLGELLVESPDQYHPAVNLAWGDVAVDSLSSPSMVKIHLKRSKCDQFGKGIDVVVGKTDSLVCPVKAMMVFIAARRDSPGPFFIIGVEAASHQVVVCAANTCYTGIAWSATRGLCWPQFLHWGRDISGFGRGRRFDHPSS